MSEYISRQAAIDTVKYDYFTGYTQLERVNEIKAIPAADVAPVVHAKWENYSPVTIKCSRCGHVIHDWRYSECKYCPNCGAKMDGGESDG